MKQLIIAFVTLSSFALPSLASELSKSNDNQLWVNFGIYSHHFDKSKSLRDNNSGLGLELAIQPAHVVMLGKFKNSNYSETNYVAYEWRPMHWKPYGINLYGGILVGAFDGYPNYRNSGWFIAPLPVLSIEGKRIGANVSLIPKLDQRTDSALSVQLKFRIL